MILETFIVRERVKDGRGRKYTSEDHMPPLYNHGRFNLLTRQVELGERRFIIVCSNNVESIAKMRPLCRKRNIHIRGNNSRWVYAYGTTINMHSPLNQLPRAF